MKEIVAVAVVRDECDIIELFVRACLVWADRIVVVDNGSTDATPHILRLLIEEGLPVDLRRDDAIDHQQGRTITRLARQLASEPDVDFIVPLDADEFVAQPKELRSAFAKIPQGRIGAWNWIGLVPGIGSIEESPRPLDDFFMQRRTEVRNIQKIVLTRSLASDAVIGEGNHDAHDMKGKPLPKTTIEACKLAHAPVRSCAQIISKSLIGSSKLSIKENRKPHEGFHWDAIAALVRGSGYRLSHEQLVALAVGYGTSLGDTVTSDLVKPNLEAGPISYRYPELARINLMQRFDGFSRTLCEEVHRSRTYTGEIGRLFRSLRRRFG